LHNRFQLRDVLRQLFARNGATFFLALRKTCGATFAHTVRKTFAVSARSDLFELARRECTRDDATTIIAFHRLLTGLNVRQRPICERAAFAGRNA
jgi:hypothetical protein